LACASLYSATLTEPRPGRQHVPRTMWINLDLIRVQALILTCELATFL
jgi:hypothetical protein